MNPLASTPPRLFYTLQPRKNCYPDLNHAKASFDAPVSLENKQLLRPCVTSVIKTSLLGYAASTVFFVKY